MTINVLSAARHMAKQSNWSLSNLKLQKLIYLAHMFHMGRFDGRALVDGHFEAWDYGPVHPTLYHQAKVFGAQPVRDIFGQADELHEGSEKELLDEAYAALGHAGAGQLVNATHRKNGAWDQYYIPGARRIIIPNSAICAEYMSMGADE